MEGIHSLFRPDVRNNVVCDAMLKLPEVARGR